MSDSASRPGPPRVCYYMQTHTRPQQILRLVTLIKEGSQGSVVVIDHDASLAPLDASLFRSLPDVHVLNGPGGYGDFSHLDRYFAAVDWLDAQGITYDWLQNMTGQDYPLRPIAEIERVLADSMADGFLQYAPVHPERTPPGADWGAGPEFRLCKPFDTHMRFDYRHHRVGRPTRAKQRWLRPIMIINFLQPWIRVSLGFSTFGLRRTSTIFDDHFICYGGSFFCVLSAPCVRYARDFARDHPDVVAYFRTMPAPDEVFLQTVLVNSGKFRLVPDGKHYIDFSSSHNNHPKTLGVADLPAMSASGAHWARKFDPSFDPAVFDVLDQRVRPESQATIHDLRRSMTQNQSVSMLLSMGSFRPFQSFRRPDRAVSPTKSDPEATVSRFFEAYHAGNSPLPVYLMRGRSLGALISLGRLPCLRVAPSAGVEGAVIRAKLLYNPASWRLTGLATAVLRLPEEPGRYALGASKQTLRRKVRQAKRLGIRWEEVDDPRERRNLLKLAADCERTHPDANYRNPDPAIADLLDYRLWLVARAADGRPLLLSVTPVDGDLAMLHYFRTLGPGEEQSLARYFMTEVLAERLVSLGVRHLIDGSNLFWLPNGLRHFQRMTGFRLVRIRVTRPRS